MCGRSGKTARKTRCKTVRHVARQRLTCKRTLSYAVLHRLTLTNNCKTFVNYCDTSAGICAVSAGFGAVRTDCVLKGFEPGGHLDVAPFAGKVGSRLAFIALVGGIGSMGDEQFGQRAAIGGRS